MIILLLRKIHTIFERAQFNKRVQLDGESVNTFITALYTLSEHCEYGALHNELIRDRIVVGIRDKNLSEKLQLDADLTLTKVIERVRFSEVVKEQQEILIEKDSVSVNAISPNKPAKFLKQKPSSGNVFQNAKLEPPDNILCGPDRNPFKTLGKFNTNIEYKGKSCTEEIYVISNLQTCLLGKPALFSLGLGPNLNSICQISEADTKAKFPELFKGVGVMKGCYSIKLKPGAIPFAITSPKRPNYSDILFPLTFMLSNKVTFVWEAPKEAAFQKMKKILSSDPALMIFDPGKETTVATDASSYGLGATICQKQTDR
ncbi:hypothetical protein AVEN_85193-1 [Araneus ventricosus]|uniref:Reverse transcriptase/retrotransposon-derived protein RNase H-like domain-containing protein n=1 Tax=Araneus ventricosus TaxID=182803 RepID=A0A4Y2WYN0_ARAVE|nr:hypothetical protein AVEN_85193-1 [Araneus ventricosus]